jgi:hypothetical protein
MCIIEDKNMSTLHLNRTPQPIQEVPLEDWYEELSDESLDPLNILVSDEDDAEPANVSLSLTSLENNMTATIAKNTNTFDVNAWLTQAAVLNDEAPKPSQVACPPWLVLSSGIVSTKNAFIVTAGVIKATRQVIDAIGYTQRALDEAIENLLQQEARAGRTTSERHNFGPAITALGVQLSARSGASEAPGFNPDGNEYQDALDLAAEEVEKLEAVVKNGKRILTEIIDWVNENSGALGLQVEVGHTVTLGIIGQEIHTAKYRSLDADSLMLGVQAQRDFLRNQRMSKV